MKRVGKQVIGVILIVLGFLALVTPATPGSWLILIGLEFLGLRLLLSDRLLACADAHPGTHIHAVEVPDPQKGKYGRGGQKASAKAQGAGVLHRHAGGQLLVADGRGGEEISKGDGP